MNKTRILIFTYTDVNRDPIVLNQIEWLKSDYDLYVACGVPDNSAGVKYFTFPKDGFVLRNLKLILLKLRLYKLYEKRKREKITKQLSGYAFSLIIVHHLKLLPAAFAIKPKAKILFYAHEYYMSVYDHSFWWKFLVKKYFLWLAERYLPKCDFTITVNESIRNLYASNYGITAGYIHNCVPYENYTPLMPDKNKIKIIYHGLAGANRELEKMIELMDYLDKRFTLTLVLQTNSLINDLYIRKLKKMSAGNERIIFRGLVPFNEVVKMGNEYDIGLFIPSPTTLNIKYNLAHKIFQYIQSRLMLVISPLPEMEKIVKTYGTGIVAENYSTKDLAERLNMLSAEEILGYKRKSDEAARHLTAESNREKFLEKIKNLPVNEVSEKQNVSAYA